MTFSKRLLSNSLPPGKNVRSNITKFPTLRYDLWSPAQTKIQISLPMGQQENSNALPPGQSDQFSICTNPIIHIFYPPQFCIIIVYNFSWDMKMSQGKSKTMPMQFFWGVEAVYYGIVQVENQNPALCPASPPPPPPPA